MLHRILHLNPPMLENFAFSSLEDALDDLIGAWEDGDVDLTGIVTFLKEKGVRIDGLETDADVDDDTKAYLLESAGLMARGLICGNPAVQMEMRNAIAMGAGIIVLPVTDPWFEGLANYCNRRVFDLPLSHPDPFLEAAVRNWIQRA
jgi:hypothetical protein